MNKTKQVAKCKNLLPFQRYLYVSGYVKKNTFKICPGKEIKCSLVYKALFWIGFRMKYMIAVVDLK